MSDLMSSHMLVDKSDNVTFDQPLKLVFTLANSELCKQCIGQNVDRVRTLLGDLTINDVLKKAKAETSDVSSPTNRAWIADLMQKVEASYLDGNE